MLTRTRLLEVCLLVFTTVSSCLAQSGATGTIAGYVTDSSGASVPNANVTITNQATNVRHDTVASSSGTYSVPSLLPGVYVVSISSNGFSTKVVTGVRLAVGQRVTVDIELKPGVVTESISIAASAAVLDTENAAVGQVVNERQLVDLPLNGRNFTQLLLLGAGAVQVNGEQGIFRANEGNALSIQGGRADSNVYMLDGLVINDSYYQTPAVIPSIDVLQEFQEQTKGYSAAYGGGANQINLITKSGTNQLHGTAYNFIRNDALDARNFFDPQIIPPLRQNQFGYTLGGPVWIPKLYDGRNKTFFFTNYEGLRIRTSRTAFALVPTTAELSGVFTSSIIDPSTMQPFPNNTIPQDRFSTFGKSAAAHFPAPNVSLPQGNYRFTQKTPAHADQQSYRVDHHFSPKDSFFARYTQTEYTVAQPGGILPEGTSYLNQPTRQVAASYTHTFSPTLVNQLRFGWMRERVTLAGTAISESEWNALGLKGLFPYNQYTTYPQISWMNTGLSGAGGPGYAPQEYRQPTYQISDTFSLIRGRHTIGMGADVRWFSSYVNNFSSPKFTFDGLLTGQPVADMLLGFAAISNAQAPTQFATDPSNANSQDFHLLQVAPWIQDDWKISPRLTINLGLRYDFMPKPNDSRDNIFWLNPNIPGGGLYTANKDIIDAGIGGSLYEYGGTRFPGSIQWHVFAPRFGFAYRPSLDNRVVIRAGFGLFYDSFKVKETVAGGQYPFAQQSVFYNVSIATLFPPTPPLAPVTSANLGFVWLSPSRPRAPYVEMWTASVEREFARGIKLEADYLGSAAHHLVGRVWQNAPYPYNSAAPSPASARVPYPNLGRILDHPMSFNSNYNALSLKLERRGREMTFLATYTWSHSLDNKSSDSGINGDPSGNGPMNQYNWRLDYASSTFDVRHNFVGSFVYELPLGKGKRFRGNAGTLSNLVIGGWQLNGIVTLHSGLPYTVTASDLQFLNQNSAQRADLVGNPNPSGFKRSIDKYFKTEAFAQPALGQFGTAGRNLLRGPRTTNFDLSLFKSISLAERLRWQIRLEAFNAFNHANFGFPIANINSASVGAIRTAAPGRILQVAMKLIW